MAERLCVGIDIGASSVKVCQLKAGKRGFSLERFGLVPLPSETIVDGALMNSARVVEAVQELVASHKIRNKQAAISVSGHSVIIKKIPLPQMSQEKLEESIQWEAEQFIPFDIADVNLSVQIVNPQSAQSGYMDVVLVAAKKDYVNEYTSVINEAGLDPVVCDVDVFAVQNSFEANYDAAPADTIALVNVGATKTNINIIARGISCFTRDLTLGGNAFTEEIQKQMGVQREEAEAMKLSAGGQRGSTPQGVPPEVDQALRTIAENLTTEVQRSLDFYSATSSDPSASRVYLSGGTSRLTPFVRALESRLRVPIAVVNPFSKIEVNPADRDYIESISPMATVAVGLALRSRGDG